MIKDSGEIYKNSVDSGRYLTLNVGPSGCQFTTIQSAINAAAAGVNGWPAASTTYRYTINVYPGTYAETITITSIYVTITGICDKPNDVYIGGSINADVITLTSAYCSFKNVTIINTHGTYSRRISYVDGSSTVFFDNCLIVRQFAGFSAASANICFLIDGSASFFNCHFSITSSIITLMQDVLEYVIWQRGSLPIYIKNCHFGIFRVGAPNSNKYSAAVYNDSGNKTYIRNSSCAIVREDGSVPAYAYFAIASGATSKVSNDNNSYNVSTFGLSLSSGVVVGAGTANAHWVWVNDPTSFFMPYLATNY